MAANAGIGSGMVRRDGEKAARRIVRFVNFDIRKVEHGYQYF